MSPRRLAIEAIPLDATGEAATLARSGNRHHFAFRENVDADLLAKLELARAIDSKLPQRLQVLVDAGLLEVAELRERKVLFLSLAFRKAKINHSLIRVANGQEAIEYLRDKSPPA